MLKTIWLNIGIYTATIAWTVAGILISPFAYAWFRWAEALSAAETTRKLIWIYGHIWVRLTSLFIPIEMAQGTPPSPCVMVVNHASFFDMYLIGAQPEWNLCIAVRDWPFRIFFYRPFMEAAGYIKTESTSPDAIIDSSVNAIEQGGTVFFYPEGTRSSNGQLGRFHSGAFHVAMAAGAPVVPVCISGSYELLPRGKWILNPSKVKVRLLPPIYPDKYINVANGHIAMRKEVKKRMAQALEEMAENFDSTSRS